MNSNPLGTVFAQRIKEVLALTGVSPQNILFRETGMDGCGGFVSDHGENPYISDIHIGDDGEDRGNLLVRFVWQTSYTVLEVKTDKPHRVAEFLMSNLPCKVSQVVDRRSLLYQLRRRWRRSLLSDLWDTARILARL